MEKKQLGRLSVEAHQMLSDMATDEQKKLGYVFNKVKIAEDAVREKYARWKKNNK